ncbi:FtsW/RodA/SpoVE family cell cycle protein [Actinomycetospora chiangmaiensis]|uniref:FtsW/RodA/SpoVE family cell cycle protein n=1 Tax=Actinomycetospora chiangmaiensis TaxID=402650 RepID=UPI0003607F25|nr:FtsW/RodA/SpoVE family cell cycle protein [Actinomycetospora chiangmaiensis]
MLTGDGSGDWEEPLPDPRPPWGDDGRPTRRSGRAARRADRADRAEERRREARRDHDRPEPRGQVLADLVAVAAAVVLVALGALNLVAAGEPAQARDKVVTAGVGIAVMLALAARRRPVSTVLARATYGVTVALLLLVLVAGLEVNGARRWLGAGALTIQPSELAKIAVPLVLAAVLGVGARSWRRFAAAVPLAGLPIVLVAVQPDLSTAALLTATAVAVLVLARVPARHLLPVVAGAVVAAPLALGLMHDYQLERLGTYLSGSQSAAGPGWAVRQARLAMARGGWFGDHADPVHALAATYLPERDTDLAPASLVAGWGLVAGLLALGAGLVIVWRCALGARAPRSSAGTLLSGGFAVLLGVELVVSLGGNLGVLPVAGVPFPILSAGGTSTVVHLAALGLVLGARRDGAHRRLWAPAAITRPRLVRTAVVTVTVVLLGVAGYGAGALAADRPALVVAGTDQMTRCVTVPAPRGTVVDRHGAVLAADAGDVDVRVAPALLMEAPEAVDRLRGLLGRSPAELRRQLEAAPATTVDLDVGVVPGPTGTAIGRAALPGVVVVPAPRRNYPTGPVLAPVLGWVGAATPVETARAGDLDARSVTGRAGVEASYDGVLRGVDGEQCYWVDPGGRPVATGSTRPAVPGATLTLTIDLVMQQRLVADVATSLQGGPRGAVGAAVALDPRSGAVLALASWPSHDDALYGPPLDIAALQATADAPGSPLLDHAIASAVPPGSTFKLVNATASVTHPVVPADEVVETGGSYVDAGHVFNNWRVLPPQNLVDAIAWSNDVYFYKLAVALGPETMIGTAHALGVGSPTGIDLPGESAGYLGTPESVAAAGGTWYRGSTIILGIGQGPVQVTPLQDARWTAAVTTGALATPFVGMSVGPTPLPHPPPVALPFADRLGPVRDGMRAMVTRGTGRGLDGLGVPVAAKSGTAEDPSVPGGGVDDWMTAAAPADAPSVVVTAWAQRPDVGTSRTAAAVADTLRTFGGGS